MKAPTFHVSHGDWRDELQLPGEYMLADLVHAIVAAVGSDMDSSFKRPKLLASAGTPPVQYLDGDEEEG